MLSSHFGDYDLCSTRETLATAHRPSPSLVNVAEWETSDESGWIFNDTTSSVHEVKRAIVFFLVFASSVVDDDDL